MASMICHYQNPLVFSPISRESWHAKDIPNCFVRASPIPLFAPVTNTRFDICSDTTRARQVCRKKSKIKLTVDSIIVVTCRMIESSIVEVGFGGWREKTLSLWILDRPSKREPQTSHSQRSAQPNWFSIFV